MSGKHYSPEVKMEAVKQVTVDGLPVALVASRLGIAPLQVFLWLNTSGPAPASQPSAFENQIEVKRLKKALKKMTEERNCLKEAIDFYTQQMD
ncbi:transposase [Enterobacter adelaidei]